MSQSAFYTILLRGGHRWICASADADGILAHLGSPSLDSNRLFILRGTDGTSLTVPAREIVGVIGEDRAFRSLAQPAVLPHAVQPKRAMRKDATLRGSPMVFVDDFLEPADFDKVLAFVLGQETAFVPATVTDTVQDYRSAKVLFDVAQISDLFLPWVRTMAPLALSLLDMQPVIINAIECQLTAHGTADYFRRHNDNGSPETAGRTLSYVYYFNREPKSFDGGQLRMYETVIQDGFYTGGISSKDIEPRCNSLIMFPSYCQHEVLPVTCPSGKFADRRFTVNGWVVRAS